jgi:hypothetical protein
VAVTTIPGGPVHDSVLPVVQAARHVRVHPERVGEIAGWMAYEDLPFPSDLLPFRPGRERADVVDFVLLGASIDFAFTDFVTGERFEVDHAGRRWSDSDAMFACLDRALGAGTDILSGAWLRDVTEADLARVFTGSIEMPMLADRAQILRDIGDTLVRSYGGRFSNVVEAASPRLYDDGAGLLDVLVRDFPRFHDVSDYDGRPVRIYKLGQLAVWMLHNSLGELGGLRVDDIDRMSAFADYIVPVGLRLMGALSYSDELERRINEGDIIERDSPEEVEIRAATVYACALLTAEVNARRPADRAVIVPQVDARIWTHFHTTSWPHHLTRTTMY